MTTYSDNVLNNVAIAYQVLKGTEYGITFEQFIDNPALLVNRRMFLPLLPRQREIQIQLDIQSDLEELAELLALDLETNHQVNRRNGAFVEPLHHHTYPRKARRRDVCSTNQ